MTVEAVRESLQKVRWHIEAEGFRGYDPYDVLTARRRFLFPGTLWPFIATQIHKRNPVNIRRLLGIGKDFNPKALGLLLEAYSLLRTMQHDDDAEKHLDFLFSWLSSHSSPGYHGHCWGYNFDWASPGKYLKAYTPSVVVTSFVAKGIIRYYLLTKNEAALDILRSVCDFILKDLPVTESADGICFSYTPLRKDCCYNANMLGAEILTKVYSLSKEERLRECAQRAVDFTIAHQHDDGHWNYSIDLETGRERKQIDFHQGYILDSLYDFIKLTNTKDDKYHKTLERGAHYYLKEQFLEDGRAKWRVPRVWPVDIHNQAQGIITFAKLRDLDTSYLDFAEKIAAWTIENMQDENGYFYYQKHSSYMNKIPYMRWAQAWMFLALTIFLHAVGDNR